MKERKTARAKLSLNQRIDRWLLRLLIFSKLAVFFPESINSTTPASPALTSLQTFSRRVPKDTSLLLGIGRLKHVLRVRPMKTRSELGNLLVVAPTRGGKGLLAVSQLLTWPHSVVVNDIKGDLFTQTAGYRSTLGPVLVIDPTGAGHRYDPLTGKQTEDELLSSATQLLFRPDEGDGAIFTQRATVMLTQLFLAARQEGFPPLPYVRTMIRDGLVAAVSRLQAINPELATQFLNVAFPEATSQTGFSSPPGGRLTPECAPSLPKPSSDRSPDRISRQGSSCARKSRSPCTFAGRSGTFSPLRHLSGFCGGRSSTSL